MPSAAPKTTTKTLNKTPAKNPWRERLKAELALLRVQVRDLERQRLALEMHGSSPSLLARQRPEKDPFLSMALVENRRLQVALDRQVETAKALVEALMGLSVESLGIDLFSVARQLIPTAPEDDFGNHREAWLLAEVKRAYDEIDQVLEPVNLQQWSKPPTSGFFSRVVEGKEELVLETRETLTIQLDFDRFTRILWRAIHRAPWDRYKTDPSMPDCVLVQLRYDGVVQGKTLDLLATFVVKKFVKKDCVTIVWCAVTTIENNDQYAEVFVENTGYSRMTRTSHPQTGAEIVYKQNCVHAIPRSTVSQSAVHYPHTGAFTNLVLASSATKMAAVDELAENMLIEACMGEMEP